MRFTFAILSLAAVAAAQSTTASSAAACPTANCFNVPQPDYLLTAGQSQTFTWGSLSQGTVTIYLTEGANSDLKTIATLASNIPNQGTYTYNVPADITESANYALKIVDDQDTSIVNYTPQFVIQSPVKAIQTSGGTTSLVTDGVTASGTASSAGSMVTVTTTAASATGSSSASSRSSGSAASTGASSTGASASKTSGAAASSGTPPSSGAAAQGVKAVTGLLALAVGVVVVL